MSAPPPELLASRQASLRVACVERGLDGLLVTSLPNIAYLTGFQGSAGILLVVAGRSSLIVDGRYDTVAGELAAATGAFDVMTLAPAQTYEEALIHVLRGLTGTRIGFEDLNTTVRRHRELQQASAQGPALPQLIPTDGLVEALRMVKDAWEAGILRDGGARLSDAAKCILPRILAGQRERDVAAIVEGELRRVGFDKPAFDTIVAAGPNAASPHHRPGDRRLEAGDLVVVDFGGVLHGYCTDMTRTVVVGGGDREAQALVELVTAAQVAAMAAVSPGQAPEAVDQAARDVLDGQGLADRFTHGTGHGLGLEIHERPRIGRARPGHAEPRLAPGMVFTLEPGVYLPGRGGARIEDDVLVTAEGREILTGGPAAL